MVVGGFFVLVAPLHRTKTGRTTANGLGWASHGGGHRGAREVGTVLEAEPTRPGPM